MSEKIKVTIRCKKVVTYEKEIELTKEDYAILEEANGKDIYPYSDKKAYNILDLTIDNTEVTDYADEFLDFEMETVE